MDLSVDLLDIDDDMVCHWERLFYHKDYVKVVHAEFSQYMDDHYDEIDCVCSAANSFGIIDGGLDGVYKSYFNEGLQTAIQDIIVNDYMGEQPVCSSFIVEIPNHPGKRLIHTPTMRSPGPLYACGGQIVYMAARSALVTALKHGVHRMIMPAYAHMTGRVPAPVVSEMMYKAFTSVERRIDNTVHNTWGRLYEWNEL